METDQPKIGSFWIDRGQLRLLYRNESVHYLSKSRIIMYVIKLIWNYIWIEEQLN